MSSSLCVKLTQWMCYAVKLNSTYLSTCVANGLCSIVAVSGNLVIILAILRNSSLHTPSYVLLCNLAISDLGVGLFVQPLFIALRITEAKGLVDISCKLGFAYFSTAGCFAWLSFLTLTAVSVDRLLAVYLGPKYRAIVTVTKTKIVIFFLWIIAVVVGLIYVLDIASYFLAIISLICVCLLITSTNYFAIGRSLKRREARFQKRNKQVNATKQRRNSFNFGRYKKTITSMMYVYWVFLLCYLPYLCFSVVLKLVGRTSAVQEAYLVTATLVLANSAFNPCLYYWRILELRNAVKKLIGWREVAVTCENKPDCTYNASRDISVC